MSFPSGSQGLIPWMNSRPPGTLSWETTIVFDPGTNVVFRWIEDGTWASPSIRIYAHGTWGDISIGHLGIAVAITANPGSTTHTVANRAALFALPATAGQTGRVTSDNSYWIAQDGNWIRTVVEVNAGTVSAYGITADVKTITVPMADIPAINGQGLLAGRYYNICLEENGFHYSGGEGSDAIFALRPLNPLQGGIVTNCALCGIKLKKPRPQFYWPSGKPKCAMQ